MLIDDVVPSHPFGDKLKQHLSRRKGLNQSKLAAGVGLSTSVISEMVWGKRITGPSARYRVLSIIRWLHIQGVLTNRAEADELLNAALMIELQEDASSALERELYALPTMPTLADPPVISGPQLSTANPTIEHEEMAPGSALPKPEPLIEHEDDLQNLKPRLGVPGNTLHRPLDNLPARRYTTLVGRKPDVELVLNKLRTLDATASSVITISGLGGIGKTALAYEVAKQVLVEGRFDGLVWESAKPEELEGYRIIPLANPPSVSLEGLIMTITKQLGFHALLQLKPDELYSRVRTILQTGSYLIVVDNLETVVAYEELTRQLHTLLSPSQSSRPSRALVTSRERLIDIPYIYDHYITGLSKPASVEFMEQEAQDRGALGLLQAGQELLDRVFEVTGGMPLAMKLLVSQFLAGIALDIELERLKAVEEKDLYKYIYMRLWFKLSAPAQKVLIAAAAFASSVARFMLEPVSRTSSEEFETAIPELVRMSLVEPSEHLTAEQRRYSIHSITRWFINAPLRDLWEQQKGHTR